MSFSASHTYGNRAESSGTSRGSAASIPFFNKQPQRFFQPATRIQPKLTVNAPNDIYEKEADAMADQVMRMPDPQIHRQEEEEVMMKPQPSSVQRKCAECEAEEKLQRKPLAGTITTFIQRKETDGGEVSRQTAALLQSTKSGGRTMPEHTRNWMESRFGTDFSGVKVHTDSNAVQMNRDLHAKAFTHGRDIYFNRGEFTPGTNEGKRLLAHELTHVVQQGADVRTKSIQREEGDCSKKKQVVVDLISFPGSTRNPYDDLAEANRIFSPCCVEFVPGQGKSVDSSFSDPLMGNDATFERAGCGEDTPEEQALIPAAARAFNLRGRLRVFYFENINPSARATSHPQYCSSPLTLNHVYMTNSGAPRTLAHEFGHILLNGFFHELPPDNLMHPSNTATGSNLTPEQCTTIQNNV